MVLFCVASEKNAPKQWTDDSLIKLKQSLFTCKCKGVIVRVWFTIVDIREILKLIQVKITYMESIKYDLHNRI